jgi:hypothetical protein
VDQIADSNPHENADPLPYKKGIIIFQMNVLHDKRGGCGGKLEQNAFMITKNVNKNERNLP